MRCHFKICLFVLFDGLLFGFSPDTCLCFMACLMTSNVLADKKPPLKYYCFSLGCCNKGFKTRVESLHPGDETL